MSSTASAQLPGLKTNPAHFFKRLTCCESLLISEAMRLNNQLRFNNLTKLIPRGWRAVQVAH